MSSLAAPAGLSWEQFLDLPEDVSLRHAELVDGEVVVSPPTRLHQLVAGRLWAALDTWSLSERGDGEATLEPPVQITERRGYLPDVAWFPSARCAPAGEPPAFSGPPALAVEVLSPSTRLLDEQRKRTDYARIGVDELWLVDPAVPAALLLRKDAGEREFHLAADLAADDALASPLLPGFAVPLRELVARG